MCTSHVCCQLWHLVQIKGHSPNKHIRNLRPHSLKWKEVCSTSHTRTQRAHVGRERSKGIDINNNARQMKWSWAGHINRLKYDRWTSRGTATSWRPYDKKRRQAEVRRPGQILEGHDMAEDSTRLANLETACWGIRPTTGHYCCPMIMMNDEPIGDI